MIKSYLSLVGFLGFSSIASSQAVVLSNWTDFSTNTDATFVGNGNDGFVRGMAVNSTGSAATGAESSFDSDVTLGVGESLQFDFTMTDIVIQQAQNNVGFRVGFENISADSALDATIHFVFSSGGGVIGRFGGASGSANPYSQGTLFDSTNYTGATSIATGPGPIDISVSLTLLGVNGSDPSLFDYEASILWDGVTNGPSTVFTRNTDTWNSVYVLTNNNAAFGLAGDTYTIGGAAVSVIPEPSSAPLVMSALAMIGVLAAIRRRRMS
ncbi:MAG: PEP-CTERM sorting domain-containing protein [Verrucomicrobiota bacterium]